jgi:hypothetical protein
MTDADEWLLAGGGRIVFIPHDGDPGMVAVDHMGRHDDSCARLAVTMPRGEAEAIAEDWLRQAGKSRLRVMKGGRA